MVFLRGSHENNNGCDSNNSEHGRVATMCIRKCPKHFLLISTFKLSHHQLFTPEDPVPLGPAPGLRALCPFDFSSGCPVLLLLLVPLPGLEIYP